MDLKRRDSIKLHHKCFFILFFFIFFSENGYKTNNQLSQELAVRMCYLALLWIQELIDLYLSNARI